MGTSFGRGGATTFQQDLQNSDCILIMGSNMAECHPVGFQWVMEAKLRGATVIHVDPRFSRTSAVADVFVPIRAGSDIAFLGAVVNHILENGREFRDYVVAYTNASAILSEDFRDTEDLDGLFSGWDPETCSYDNDVLAVRRPGPGHPRRRRPGAGGVPGPAARRPRRCPSAASRRRPIPPSSTPAACSRCSSATSAATRRSWWRRCAACRGSSSSRWPRRCAATPGRERTSAFCYAVGWTQHTVGVQYIRTAAIIQLLLGNIGRPGGGILALRGHASIQGSTDIPTLYDLLPGYLAMPHAALHGDLAAYLRARRKIAGAWAHVDAYLVSLLKAWWGDHATADNDFCFDHLPRISGDHSAYQHMLGMLDGTVKGYFLFGQNPAVGSSNSRLHRLALAKLDWLVVRDLVEIESATFWLDGPEIETGELVTADVGTEVFLLPAAAHTEKDGTFTNTQRLLQWHHKAVEPPGDCRSDLWFTYHLGRLIREKLAGLDRPPGPTPPGADVGLPGGGTGGRAERRGRPPGGQRLEGRRVPAVGLHRAGRRRLDQLRLLDLLRLLRRRRQPDGPAQARQRNRTGWRPSGRGRGRPTGGCSTTGRRPTRRESPGRSARSTCGGTRTPAAGPVPTCPTSRPPSVPTTGRRREPRPEDGIAGDDPFIVQGDGLGWLFAPTGLLDGPLPAHYEPHESPVANPLYAQQANPVRKQIVRKGNRSNPTAGRPGNDVFPYVVTTYRLTEHHTAGGMSRFLAYLSELQPAPICEVSPQLAAERGLTHGGWVTVVTARSAIEARLLVTDRVPPLRVGGRTVHQVGLPYHWGSRGLSTGDSANDLLGLALDPNVVIQESKAGTCDVRPGRRPRGPALVDFVAGYRVRAGLEADGPG